MCGIVGIVGKNGKLYRELIPSMLKTIRHRGPDGYGVSSMAGCSLGHVRLSIVDLDNGQQPMQDAFGKTEVVFNGEIYGFQEIKTRISYPFSTNCDTEVLLALYQKYGTDMSLHLPGMFSFAIWDKVRKSLYCARDRFGEKPFFYAIGSHGEFIFASEIKAILATGLVKPQLDLQQLNYYLCYSYIYPTRTIYKNIYTLPPAHDLRFQDGKIQIRRYWNLPLMQETIRMDDAVEQFRKLFKQAVRRQLVSDVPVGAFLSGGLDSGTVVATAAQMVPKLTTISFGFDGGINELKIARTMARKYQTNHIELIDRDFDIAELLYKMQDIYDEPMADPASIPAYLIAKYARQHVKVVLTGDAGDEILGGYDFKYRPLWYLEKWYGHANIWQRFMVRTMLNVIGKIRKVARRHGFYSNDPSVRLHELRYHDLFLREKAIQWEEKRRNHKESMVEFLRHENQYVPQALVKKVENFPSQDKGYFIDDGYLAEGNLDNALRLDIQEYLPGNGMVKTDRTTMAVGLESRTPFLDVDFASFCIGLPISLKLHGMQEKFILREAFSKEWTPEVRHTIKNGFGAPFNLWMNRPRVREMKHEYLCDKQKRIFEVINFNQVQRIMKENKQGFLAWELLNLSMWFEQHPCAI